MLRASVRLKQEPRQVLLENGGLVLAVRVDDAQFARLGAGNVPISHRNHLTTGWIGKNGVGVGAKNGRSNLKGVQKRITLGLIMYLARASFSRNSPRFSEESELPSGDPLEYIVASFPSKMNLNHPLEPLDSSKAAASDQM